MTSEINPERNLTPNRLSMLFFWLFLGLLYTVNMVQEPLFSSNQNTKYLHGAAAAGYRFLQDDWQSLTADPLPLFSMVVEWLYRLNAVWLSYILFSLLVSVFLYTLVKIAVIHFPLNRTRTGTALLLALLFIEYKNVQTGVASQYLLGNYLQPCVFGVFLLLSLVRFLKEDQLTAAALLAVSAAFHPAYLPMAVLMQTSYTGIEIIERKKRTPAVLLAPGLFAILSLPLLVRHMLIFAPSSPELEAASINILSNIRIPHHTLVQAWFTSEDATGIALYAGALLTVRKSPLFRVMALLFSVAVLSIIVLFFVKNAELAFLTPWRTSVVLAPLSWTLLGAWLIGRAVPFLESHHKADRVIQVLSILVILISTVIHIPQQKNILDVYRHGREMQLMNFVKTRAGTEDLYLVPPRNGDFEKFRLETGVPMLVNWKTHPYKDREVVEWYERIRMADDFYGPGTGQEKIDRLKKLAARYRITHVVTDTGMNVTDASWLKEIYRDGVYKVLELSQTNRP